MSQPAWRQLYPFASHRHAISAPGGGHVHMHYVDEGEGKPVLFVHGNPTWSFYYRNLILGVRPHARAVAVDHIGCGLSDKPAEYPYTLQRRIDDLAGLVEALDLRDITLVVHDWGGPIGLGAALAAPERYAKLAILNTGAFPPPFLALRIRMCRFPLAGEWAMRRLNLFARAALWMATEKPQRLTPEVCAGLLAPYDTPAHRVAIARFVQDIPLSPRHPTWQVLERIERELPQLADRPAVLIWGLRDWCFTPECLRRMQVLLPQAERVELTKAGHYVVEDAWEHILPPLRQLVAPHADWPQIQNPPKSS